MALLQSDPYLCHMEINSILDTIAIFIGQAEDWMCENVAQRQPEEGYEEAFELAARYYMSLSQFLDTYNGDVKQFLRNGGYAQPTALIHIHMALSLFDDGELLDLFTDVFEPERLSLWQQNAAILKRAKDAFDAKGTLFRERDLSNAGDLKL